MFAARQASAKMSVSGPGISDAVSNISWRSYMIPCVLYSGKIARSIPGSPTFAPTIMSPIFLQLSITSWRVCRRGILYWKTAHPTVSGLLTISPCLMA